MLTKKSAATAGSARRLRGAAARPLGQTMDRRAFLKRSGLGVGAGAIATQLPYNLIGAADAAAAGVSRSDGPAEVRRTVCTHCSVGCSTDAIVRNGVWVHQEPVFDSPINLGAHCAKG
ncbi:MAG TPA: twin-arginine translocation signal domain-containing protein, partial [Thauera sp.]|nr:twin-arginine translocation signal domain-containing protein [Thauera sp.]